MFFVCAILLAAPAPITATHELHLDGTSSGHTAVLADGQTVVFVIAPAPEDLELTLASQLGGASARIVRLPKGAAEIEITAAHPVHASRIVNGPTGTTLVIDIEPRVDAVRRRALTNIPRSVPSEYIEPRVRQANTALTSGRFIDARERFEEMTKEYTLRAWSELRLADLDLIAARSDDACASYRQLVAEFPQRTAGLVAKLRLHGLECVQRDHAPIDWANLVEKLRRLDGPVGRYLLREAGWVLHLTRDPEVIASGLATTSTTRRRTRLQPPTPLRHTLLARSIRQAEPFATSKACLAHHADLLRHRESRSLLLTCARAFLELDLPDTAIEFLQKINTRRGQPPQIWQARGGKLQALVLTARAYAVAGRTYLSRRAVSRYTDAAGEPPPIQPDRRVTPMALEIGDAVSQLQTRVESLRAQLEPGEQSP